MIILIFTSAGRSNMVHPDAGREIKGFISRGDITGEVFVLKGKVTSFSPSYLVEADDIIRKADDRSQAVVRLYDREGINKGDILFVIDEHNLVQARFEVAQVYRSRSFGYTLIGYGNFRLASVGDRVVQRKADSVSGYAFRHKARGDYFINRGDSSRAILEYKKAIEYDRGYPEARLALGDIYFEEELYRLALDEYLKAYRKSARIYDRGDHFRLLKRLAEIRMLEIEMPSLYRHLEKEKRDELISKYREEAIRYCREALDIYPASADIHYYLGRLHFVRSDQPQESDTAARDHFLNALNFRPSHVESNIYLAILYYRNNNIPRAESFIEKAIEADPGNQRAHDIRNRMR